MVFLMPGLAIVLILISALIHVLWNLIGKRSQPSAPFFLTATLAASLVYMPFLWFFRQALPFFSVTVWGLVIAAGCAQALYYTALAWSYRSGDLSMTYPLIRALPVLLVALASLVAGRGDQLTPQGLAGMGLVIMGCVLVPLQNLRQPDQGKFAWLTIVYACLAAIGTTGYLLADSTALHLIQNIPGLPLTQATIPLLYIELETLATILPLSLFALLVRRERSRWPTVIQSTWKSAAFTGLIITFGYALVLAALLLARDVSYVTAFRQVSIPIGTLIGILVLKEPAYPLKLVGVGIIFCGLVLVALY
jgi:drug/metabolite transporter (DMT)-like permease